MQKLMGLMRKAIQKYDMIQPGDRIAVAVSGGKDSVALLAGLRGLQDFIGIPYELHAITLDYRFGGVDGDFSPLVELCQELGVPYTVKPTEIGQIIFETRKEQNPCSLCARMRRGCLHDAAKELGCNKIALGHHYDDAVETFVMNLFQEGRVGCFQPVTYLSRKDLTLIRPLILAEESVVASVVRRQQLPVVKSRCPADGVTQRQWTKDWLRQMDKEHPGLKKRLYGAMERGHIDGFSDVEPPRKADPHKSKENSEKGVDKLHLV